jgi:hypothetical protein
LKKGAKDFNNLVHLKTKILNIRIDRRALYSHRLESLRFATATHSPDDSLQTPDFLLIGEGDKRDKVQFVTSSGFQNGAC